MDTSRSLAKVNAAHGPSSLSIVLRLNPDLNTAIYHPSFFLPFLANFSGFQQKLLSK